MSFIFWVFAVFGWLWAIMGLTNVGLMFIEGEAASVIVFGLIFNFFIFVLPGYLIFSNAFSKVKR